MAGLANGQVAWPTKTVFDGDATNNESSGQLVRVTTDNTNVEDIIGDSTQDIYWKVQAWTRFYEDTGE